MTVSVLLVILYRAFPVCKRCVEKLANHFVSYCTDGVIARRRTGIHTTWMTYSHNTMKTQIWSSKRCFAQTRFWLSARTTDLPSGNRSALLNWMANQWCWSPKNICFTIKSYSDARRPGLYRKSRLLPPSGIYCWRWWRRIRASPLFAAHWGKSFTAARSSAFH